MNILLLEDCQSDVETCEASLDTFLTEHSDVDIKLIKAQTVDDAKEILINSQKRIEGAIIDIKIGSDDQAGNQVIGFFIDELNLRTPVIIVTGTPDSIDSTRNYVRVYKKGEFEYSTIFNLFIQISQTGLYNVMGTNGSIEKLLNDIFQQNILPHIMKWIKYKDKYSTDEIERAFTRYILSHVIAELEGDQEQFFPEECFLYQKKTKYPRPGEFFKLNTGDHEGEKWVVLTPPCDLAVRSDDSINVKDIQIALFEDEDKYIPKNYSKPLTTKQQESLINLRKNPPQLYLSFLPTTDFLHGGYINFRTVTTVSLETIKKDYSSCEIVVSPPFFKNILARFSNYYSRQGQPDLKSYE